MSIIKPAKKAKRGAVERSREEFRKLFEEILIEEGLERKDIKLRREDIDRIIEKIRRR